MKIWTDAKFNALSNDEKLAFFFALTHPAMTSVGAMRSTIEGMSYDLGVNVKCFKKIVEVELLKYDPDNKMVWLPNFFKYNQPESPNVVKSWGKSFDLIPESGFKNDIYYAAKECVSKRGEAFMKAFIEAFPEDYHKALGKDLCESFANQKQKQKQKQEASMEASSLSDFEVFWQTFPKRKNKGQAKKTWAKLKKAKELPPVDVLMAAVKEAKSSHDWLKDNGQFIPYPSTWLNAEGWKDEMDDIPSSGGVTQKKSRAPTTEFERKRHAARSSAQAYLKLQKMGLYDGKQQDTCNHNDRIDKIEYDNGEQGRSS